MADAAEAKKIEKGRDVEELDLAGDKVMTWPHLVRMEFLVALICMAGLTVWSILIDAPLEEPANPTLTPNPSKAPWYFLGLQEMLVYFDPWIAGVVLPTLIIIGLMVIPYTDFNPKGNGYYTFRERPFAVTVFSFGFLILWVSLIIIGVFFRGPGWNLFWPLEKWDPHKVLALTNVDLDYKFGIRNQPWRSIFGLSVIGAYYSVGVAWYYYAPVIDAWINKLLARLNLNVKADTAGFIKELGPVRYAVLASLFLTMMGLPVKMILRHAWNIKYVCVTPWFNI